MAELIYGIRGQDSGYPGERVTGKDLKELLG